jgi:hypothetical protein
MDAAKAAGAGIRLSPEIRSPLRGRSPQIVGTTQLKWGQYRKVIASIKTPSTHEISVGRNAANGDATRCSGR